MMGMVRADGLVRWLLVDAVPILDDDGSVRQVVSSFVDVTDRKKAERALERQALHDALTELPNRTLLLDRLEHGIRTARRLSTPLALLVMDLDRFKEVNDAFGHGVGDLVLREVAARLQALGHDEMRVRYQPIVGMDDGRATRVEALARWRHPDRGLVSPGEFVPLAERTGLVRPLFELVLNQTLRQCRAWYDAGV